MAFTVLAASGLVLLAQASAVVAVGVAGFIVVCGWLLRPATADAAPKLLGLFSLAFVFSSVIPPSASLAIQAAAVVAAVLAWLRIPATERRGTAAVGFALAILILWVLFMFNPNIPELSTGLLGFRKTAYCVAGLIAGCAIPRGRLAAVEVMTARVLALAVGASIVVFLFFPSLEAMVSRAADEYTSLFAGEKRLQGVFAGPFHAALASMVLIGWAFVRFRTYRFTAFVAMGVGFVALYLTSVRSAYVGIALMAAALIVIAPNFGRFVQRFSITIVLGAILATIVLTQIPSMAHTIASIADFATDGRFLNRLPEWDHGIEMIQASPILGSGAGSAGDTLGSAFLRGEHVTPHNMFLKIVVEGGIVGAVAWAGLGVSIIRRTDWHSQAGRVSLLSLMALIGLGLTGSAIDTLPVSFLVLFFVGLAVDVNPKSQVSESTYVPHHEAHRPLLLS